MESAADGAGVEPSRGDRGVHVYGPRDASRRSALVAFNVAGHDPLSLAQALDDAGVEARAGCHCAPLAHHALRIEASCRFSFYFYNTFDEVDHALDALAEIVSRGSAASNSPPALESTGRASSAWPLESDHPGSLS